MTAADLGDIVAIDRRVTGRQRELFVLTLAIAAACLMIGNA